METSELSSDGTGRSKAPKRLLLIADEVFDPRDFRDQLGSHVGDEEFELIVIAPALTRSALEHELAATDEGIAEANERLERILAGLSAVGIQAIGEVGDSEPILAVGDGIREYGADEILVIAHAHGESRYAEKGLLDRLGRDFTQPVVNFTVEPVGGDGSPPERPPHLVDVVEQPGGPRTEDDEIAASPNFPKLRLVDMAGIVVGIVGTIVLVILAADETAGYDGAADGTAAAMILIAIGAALINIGHVVGLLFFQSVRYEGIWEKFMARMSIGVTTVGLIASLILWQI